MAAAARLLLRRRLGAVLGLNRTRFALPVLNTGGVRLTSTKVESSILPTDIQDDPKSSKTDSNIVSESEEERRKVTYKAFSNLKVSTRHDMAMVFTCKVCETRSMKTASRVSYLKGRCSGTLSWVQQFAPDCGSLGWFGQPGSVEDFLASKGEDVKRGSVDTLNFTLEDIAGTGKSS